MAGMDAELKLHYLVTSDDYYSRIEARLNDPNEDDGHGNTLLHVAALSPNDNSRIVQLLIDRGADVNATTPDGHTPLHFAVVSRKFNTANTLLEAGALINSKDSSGRTALHLSICKEQSGFLIPETDCEMSVVDVVLSHPEIELNPVDEEGGTPLMWAVKERDVRVIKALLKKGANINTPDKHQRTPLHVALSAPNSFDDVAILLLKNGAGLYHRDNTGQTPIDILVNNVCDDRTLLFAVSCVHLIALRYRVTENLKPKLNRIPNLWNFFGQCCTEVRLMRKLVIYDKVTLHDFALDCFQNSTARVKDPVLKIFIPVVEILLTGVFKRYNDLIFCRLSKADLYSVLEIAVGESLALDLVPKDASNLTILEAIRRAYDDNVVIRGCLLVLKKFLEKKMPCFLQTAYILL